MMAEAARPPDRATSFSIRTDTSVQQIGLITVTGTLDGRSVPELANAIAAVLPTSTIIVLDLLGLADCNAAGVDAVVAADALVRAADAVLVIRPATGDAGLAFVDGEAAAGLRVAAPGPPRAHGRR